MSASSKTKSKSKTVKDGKTKVSKASKYDNVKFVELENQFVLRIPEPYAASLEEALKNGGLKDRLQITFEDDIRNAKVKFDGVIFQARLYDLPCIIEGWKTFDKKSLWKTGDICQILVCRDPQQNVFSSDDEEISTFDYLKKHLHQTKKYQHPHGLTPPLKNVRKRRFRKTAKQKYVDAPEIEKEVKRLLRADISAVDVKFEIQNDELEKQKQEEQEEDIDVGGPSVEQYDERSNMSSFIGSDTEQKHNILPDISSSDDDDDDTMQPKMTTNTNKQATSFTASLKREFEKRLEEIAGKKLEQEMKVQNAANPFLKQRFQTVLDNLKEEEDSLKQELEKEN